MADAILSPTPSLSPASARLLTMPSTTDVPVSRVLPPTSPPTRLSTADIVCEMPSGSRDAPSAELETTFMMLPRSADSASLSAISSAVGGAGAAGTVPLVDCRRRRRRRVAACEFRVLASAFATPSVAEVSPTDWESAA